MAQTQTQRQTKLTNRYKEAGLTKIILWVHPDDKDDLRLYARKKPLTSAIWDILKK